DLGLDTISTGSTIACAMKLSERGYILEDIRFGDGEILDELVQQIGHRVGIGDRLAEGSYRFASRYGHPELSMRVKGLEMLGYDPRGGARAGSRVCNLCLGRMPCVRQHAVSRGIGCSREARSIGRHRKS